jgi:hypothetical protein
MAKLVNFDEELMMARCGRLIRRVGGIDDVSEATLLLESIATDAEIRFIKENHVGLAASEVLRRAATGEALSFYEIVTADVGDQVLCCGEWLTITKIGHMTAGDRCTAHFEAQSDDRKHWAAGVLSESFPRAHFRPADAALKAAGVTP